MSFRLKEKRKHAQILVLNQTVLKFKAAHAKFLSHISVAPYVCRSPFFAQWCLKAIDLLWVCHFVKITNQFFTGVNLHCSYIRIQLNRCQITSSEVSWQLTCHIMLPQFQFRGFHVHVGSCHDTSQHVYFSRVSCALTTTLLSVTTREQAHEPDLGLSSTHGLNFGYQQEKQAESRKAAAASEGQDLH